MFFNKFFQIIRKLILLLLFLKARAIVQAKLENLVIKPTRPDMETAKRSFSNCLVTCYYTFTYKAIKIFRNYYIFLNEKVVFFIFL